MLIVLLETARGAARHLIGDRASLHSEQMPSPKTAIPLLERRDGAIEHGLHLEIFMVR